MAQYAGGDAALQDLLTDARYDLIAHRLPLFAACWIGTTALWSSVLIVEGLLRVGGALVTVTFQCAALTIGTQLLRGDRRQRRAIPRTLVSVCIFLGVSSTAMFAMARGSGDVLAFVLLSLYLSTASLFGWGWRAQALVWVGTVVPWFVAVPFLTFAVSPVELATAIVIGSVLSWAVAEGTARTFHSAWLHRSAEARFRTELEASRDVAEAATRAKDQFLATVSHELRSPLTTILTWTQLLRRREVDAETVTHAIEAIDRAAWLQNRLIEDLLDVSRIAAGKINVELVRVDLRDAVRALADTFGATADASGVELVVDVGPEPLRVHADQTRLQQILGNLVGNALKFTPEGGRVTVRARRVDLTAEIVVCDTGIGMPADVVAHVFERFHQAETGSGAREGGLGLGLAIARDLVTLHGGTIEAASGGTGQGSTFTLRLPIDATAARGLKREALGAAVAIIPW
jgi:signal transduction histidine kinase